MGPSYDVLKCYRAERDEGKIFPRESEGDFDAINLINTIVLFGSALADAINQLKFMPFLIMSGRLCPPGIEGTLFALFISINNLGNTIGSFMGAGLASILDISSESFENMLNGLAIQVVCTYIPVLFIFLIPKEATGISAS